METVLLSEALKTAIWVFINLYFQFETEISPLFD